MLREFIVSVLMAFPSWKYDAADTKQERLELITPTAEAIYAVAIERGDPYGDAATMITLVQSETGLARFILEGRCKDGPPGIRCDWDKRTGRPRARGPFQVWDWCKAAWRLPASSVAGIAAGGRCALDLVHRSFKDCGHTKWAGAFSRYRGQKCSDGLRRTDPKRYKGLLYAQRRERVLKQLLTMREKKSDEFKQWLVRTYKKEEYATD